jgi:teichuronic acid exporter
MQSATALSPVDDAALETRANRLRRRALRGGAVFAIARLATQLAAWSVTLVVARFLDAKDYGLMTAACVVVNLIDLFAEAGFGQALLQKAELTDSDLDESFTLCGGLALLLYAVLFVLAGPVAAVLAQPGLELLLHVLGLFVLLIPFKAIPQAILGRDLRLGQLSTVLVASNALQGAVVLTLAIVGAGYWSLVAGALLGRFLEVVVLLYFSAWRPRIKRPTRQMRGVLKFGLHLTGASFLWFLYSNADFAVVGKVLGMEVLGYYALAFQLMSLPVQKLTATVNQVAYPVFCRLQDDRPRLADWYLRLTMMLSFLGTPVLAGLALVAEDAFLVVLGEKWLPAVGPFQVLTTVGIVMVVAASLPPFLNVLGRSDLTLYNSLVCSVVMPLGFLIGALRAELTGVCVAWLIGYPLIVAGLFHFTRHVTGVGLGRLLRAQAPILGAALCMCGAVLGVQLVAANACSAGARLALSVVVGVVVYSGVLLLFTRQTVVANLASLYSELRSGRAGIEVKEVSAPPAIPEPALSS